MKKKKILGEYLGPKDENRELRRLHKQELHSLYHSPSIVRVNKSKRLRWTGHVARKEEGRSAFNILVCKPIGKKSSRQA